MRPIKSRPPETGGSGRSIAFYIETVIVVLMLFVVLSIVVQFFVKSYVATQESQVRMDEVATARQVAELFQSSASPDELAAVLQGELSGADRAAVNADVEFVSGSPMHANVAISSRSTGAGTLYTADITVSDQAGSRPYTLTSEHYVSDGAAEGGVQ
ncbi:MAG: hypothetical protein ACI362_03740 [Coriobacteriales bacterium]